MTVCGHKMDGVCVMGKCPYVKACNPTEWDKGESKPMTNEEWLHTLNTEQLAKWLQEHMDCSNCGCNKDLCYKGYDCCELAFLEWLKQPHTFE